jgi:hypothetical protein
MVIDVKAAVMVTALSMPCALALAICLMDGVNSCQPLAAVKLDGIEQLSVACVGALNAPGWQS